MSRFGHLETDERVLGILDALEPLREEVTRHPVYQRVTTPDHVRTFMESHVFAVWDFMSLLKALQRSLTCVSVPWVPTASRLSRRLINEIVLSEESDEAEGGGFISHFELYLQAMQDGAADTSRIDGFLQLIRDGVDVPRALARARVPAGPHRFVTTSWATIASGRPHLVAAAFALGRESLIPPMFRSLIEAGSSDPRMARFQDYLVRHVALDEEHHTPMALEMLRDLCGDDDERWRQAELAARRALCARVELWDHVAAQLPDGEQHGPNGTAWPLPVGVSVAGASAVR